MRPVPVVSALVIVAAVLHGDAALAAAAHRPEVSVLQRELLGRYIEDIDYVSSGPFNKHVVMLNGQEVHGFKLKNGSNDPIHGLFDLRRLQLLNPTGIAYVASEKSFAVVGDGVYPFRLFSTDAQGRPGPSREIRFLDDFGGPYHLEGLAYVPPTSPRFPDHLLTIGWNWYDEEHPEHVEVIRRDGQAVASIPVPADFRLPYGVAYQAPGRILLCKGGGQIGILDFDGNLLGAVTGNLEDLFQEGIVQLPDGRVVTGASARIRFYDAALNPLPQADRDASTSIRVVLPQAVAWDPDRNQHLVQGKPEAFPWFEEDHVAAAPPSLQSGTVLFALMGHVHGLGLHTPRMTYVSDEHRIAASTSPISGEGYPREVLLYDDGGTAVEWIDASVIAPDQTVPAVKITYVPSAGQFVLVPADQPSTLKFVTRSGVLAREIDLAAIGIARISALAYFNPLHPSGGQFLVFDYTGRAVITDFDGRVISEFDYRTELGLPFVYGASAITSGPQAGAFTALELGSSAQLVVFRLE